MICPIADFLVDYRDEQSGLPLASYGLWEEKRGILSWTAGAVWGGLTAAADFADNFGEHKRADRYHQVAAEIKLAVEKHLWQPDLGHFAKMLSQTDGDVWLADRSVDASLC